MTITPALSAKDAAQEALALSAKIEAGHDPYIKPKAKCRTLMDAAVALNALDAINQAQAAEITRLTAERDVLRIELDGAVTRAQMMLDAKNDWRDRTTCAEAALATERLQGAGMREVLESTARAKWAEAEITHNSSMRDRLLIEGGAYKDAAKMVAALSNAI